MISNYQIVRNESPEKLEAMVVQLIGIGWQPLGGISSVKIRYDREGNHVMEYAQAIGFSEPIEAAQPQKTNARRR